MADLNYMNPGSLDPGLGFKPDGFLGGMEWQKRNKMFQDAVSLQQLSSMRAGEKQGIELDEFKQFAPTRQAKNLADLTTAQVTTDYARPRAEADLQGVLATTEMNKQTGRKTGFENTFTEATQPSAIITKLRQDIAAQGKAGIEMLDNNIQGLHKAMILTQSGGPQAAAAAGQVLQKIGMPPEQIRQMMGDPKTMMTQLQALTKLLMDSDPRHMGEMAKVAAQGQNQKDVANITGGYTLRAAEARAAAAKKDAMGMFMAASKPADKIMKGAQILATNPSDDIKMAILAAMQQAERLLTNEEKKALGSILSATGLAHPQMEHPKWGTGNSQAPGSGVWAPPPGVTITPR